MRRDYRPLFRHLLGRAAFALLMTAWTSPAAATQPNFVRGDVDGDGMVRMNDAQRIVQWLFQGGAEPGCMDAADANDDGLVNISDTVVILDYLYQGGAIPIPSAESGSDPTADTLDCERPWSHAEVLSPDFNVDVVELVLDQVEDAGVSQ